MKETQLCEEPHSYLTGNALVIINAAQVAMDSPAGKYVTYINIYCVITKKLLKRMTLYSRCFFMGLYFHKRAA